MQAGPLSGCANKRWRTCAQAPLAVRAKPTSHPPRLHLPASALSQMLQLEVHCVPQARGMPGQTITRGARDGHASRFTERLHMTGACDAPAGHKCHCVLTRSRTCTIHNRNCRPLLHRICRSCLHTAFRERAACLVSGFAAHSALALPASGAPKLAAHVLCRRTGVHAPLAATV